MRFAEVAVDAPTGCDRTFSYSIPPTLSVAPGQMVRVPFGPRTLQGIVFALADAPQVPETRDILSTMGEEPVLEGYQLELARWISRYYMSPLFEAAALMVPPGGRLRVRTIYSLKPDYVPSPDSLLTPFQQRIVAYVQARSSVTLERAVRVFGEAARTTLSSLAAKGVLVRIAGRERPTVGPKLRDVVRLTLEGRREAEGWLPEAHRRTPRQAALVSRLLEDDDEVELSEARKEYGAAAVRQLMARGWIERASVQVERDPLAGMTFAPAPAVTLTQRQEMIVAEIGRALEDGTLAPRVFLVQGVTGSGKTEVYLAAVERALALGRRAIVMVPEIALAPQTIERFGSRFPGQVAVMHSGLPAGERFDQWWKVKQGDYGVVVGARSAIFAPQPDLGLIVIDEEHEWTYKQQDASPRYHARDAALRLAALTGAVVVLGSASPDVSSYFRGLKKEYRLLLLPHRFGLNGARQSHNGGHAPLASVQVVDMRSELRDGHAGMFSRPLLSAMEDCIKAGAQVVLFINRRGSASYMQCRYCGYGMRCRRCDVALTYHTGPERLICHYCGERRTPPDRCPQCLRYRLSFYGMGTEAVAAEVQRLFPGVPVLRWDRDTTRGTGAYLELLERFRNRDAQVLVGTQMIAKGLHFPQVTLVGVVSADVGLGIPDFRAGERAFQLLCQVAGRAGRGELPGKVIVQTYQPDNYAIRAAAAQDYQAFYTREMAFRREQANPPFSKLVRLLFSHTNMAACEREAARMAGLLRQEMDASGLSDAEVLGPTPAWPSRLRGHYRWHIVLRGPEPRRLLDRVSVPQGWLVDVDPVSLT